MFVSGMNPALGMSFMVTTMIIAVPSAIKTFNWPGTLWGGRIQYKLPMLNALAFVGMFVIGGLSGIFMASTPVDIYIQDTYFIVAHIHYVVFGGSIFGAFAAIYFWFPKLFGGKKAPLNPWNSNTLEWTAPSPPPHLNWGATLPTVYRGPYEYSSPESREDFLPQTAPPGRVPAAARH